MTLLIFKVLYFIGNIILIILSIIFLLILLFFLFNNRSYTCIKKILNKKHKLNKKRIEDIPELLNKPLKEFYINSSHNSYISNIQNGSIIFKHTVGNVLKMGARCIEIDIHDIDGEPVVAHGNSSIITSTYLSLESVLDEIVNDGFKTSDPLILYLEILNRNPDVMIKINKLLKEKFKDRRLDDKYRMSYNGVDKKDLINTPIKELLNKIIIVNASSSNIGLTDVLDDSSKFINNSTTDTLNYTNDSIRRMYMEGSFLSMMSNNFNPSPYWEKRTNMVVMNFNSYEPYLYKNLKMFEKCNFIHFSEY